MGAAKAIVLKPISKKDADATVKKYHYSGKVCVGSQVHIGVFLNGSLEGAMQFGPSIDIRKMLSIVKDTPWDGFTELNRMAFGPRLPRNSESRAIAIAMKLLKKHRPFLQWVVSFADGTQCGDGAIYRASGFVLTQINKNSTLMRMPNGKVVANKTLSDYVFAGGRTGESLAREQGASKLVGYQMRYIFPLQKDVLERLTCKILPFSAIDDAGARMYKGLRQKQ
jgi:hypothetical protein